jgi:hypothetical protein
MCDDKVGRSVRDVCAPQLHRTERRAYLRTRWRLPEVFLRSKTRSERLPEPNGTLEELNHSL